MKSIKTLAEKMKERGYETGTVPEKCSACGDYICSCRCPNCKVCGGSGYLKKKPDAVVTDRDFGKHVECPNMRSNNLKKDVAQGKGRGGLTANEIQSLSWDLIQPGISDGLKAMGFVKPAVTRGYGMGIMLGKWGQAKTLLMKIAVANFIRQGKSARYVKLTNMMDEIRMAYDEKEGKMTALVRKIEEWKDLQLLCLDEIDKDANTEWAETRLFDLVDDRWTKGIRGEALTLFASNYSSPKEIPGYLLSRIGDNRFAMLDENGHQASFVVYLAGKDGRKSAPKQSNF